MMYKILFIHGLLALVAAVPSPAKERQGQDLKDQYCTDPRTMQKHPAYTEWADVYSCTRHRCQPGGRDLAIYTVGCKRVEAPESAIECEEVVEDTNMQFPFCCTRLRCLVVVRGEVWTRVLGQPWEVLPAAPWSHMYKMKKPPPTDSTFQPKPNEQGPVYELTEPDSKNGGKREKSHMSGRKAVTESTDVNEVMPRSLAAKPLTPDIVIALSTNENDSLRRRRGRKNADSNNIKDEDKEINTDESLASTTEKTNTNESSDEKNSSQQRSDKRNKGGRRSLTWTEIPQNQWGDGSETDSKVNVMDLHYTQEPSNVQTEQVKVKKDKPEKEKGEKTVKSNNLQALVDAIGTRMKDIENVVQQMSENVHTPAESEGEKLPNDLEFEKEEIAKEGNPRVNIKESKAKIGRLNEINNRFSVMNPNNHDDQSGNDVTSEAPQIKDGNYFIDASNSLRRMPKEPAMSPVTYMAAVETQRQHAPTQPDTTEQEMDKKKKKHSHKKKKNKVHAHKKRNHNNSFDKRKKMNKHSYETEKNAFSNEDSDVVA